MISIQILGNPDILLGNPSKWWQFLFRSLKSSFILSFFFLFRSLDVPSAPCGCALVRHLCWSLRRVPSWWSKNFRGYWEPGSEEITPGLLQFPDKYCPFILLSSSSSSSSSSCLFLFLSFFHLSSFFFFPFSLSSFQSVDSSLPTGLLAPPWRSLNMRTFCMITWSSLPLLWMNLGESSTPSRFWSSWRGAATSSSLDHRPLEPLSGTSPMR